MPAFRAHGWSARWNQGWTAALATLAHERRFGGVVSFDPQNVDPGPAAAEAAAEVRALKEVYSWYPRAPDAPTSSLTMPGLWAATPIRSYARRWRR